MQPGIDHPAEGSVITTTTPTPLCVVSQGTRTLKTGGGCRNTFETKNSRILMFPQSWSPTHFAVKKKKKRKNERKKMSISQRTGRKAKHVHARAQSDKVEVMGERTRQQARVNGGHVHPGSPRWMLFYNSPCLVVPGVLHRYTKMLPHCLSFSPCLEEPKTLNPSNVHTQPRQSF